MKESLKARQAEILKCLITSSAPLDIAFFQEKFHKGERTIRYALGADFYRRAEVAVDALEAFVREKR